VRDLQRRRCPQLEAGTKGTVREVDVVSVKSGNRACIPADSADNPAMAGQKKTVGDRQGVMLNAERRPVQIIFTGRARHSDAAAQKLRTSAKPRRAFKVGGTGRGQQIAMPQFLAQPASELR